MQSVIHLYYFHGWSYDKHFFEPIDHFIKQHASCLPHSFFYNRGYQGDYHAPDVQPDALNIAITHSMGIFFFLDHYQAHDFEKIIVINGFDDFTQHIQIFQLQKMYDNLNISPETVLRYFRKLAGDKRPLPMTIWHIKQLQADLILLQTVNKTHEKKALADKIIALQSPQDAILKNKNAASLYTDFTGHCWPEDRSHIIAKSIWDIMISK